MQILSEASSIVVYCDSRYDSIQFDRLSNHHSAGVKNPGILASPNADKVRDNESYSIPSRHIPFPNVRQFQFFSIFPCFFLRAFHSKKNVTFSFSEEL